MASTYDVRSELVDALRASRVVVIVGSGFTRATVAADQPASWSALIAHGAEYALSRNLLTQQAHSTISESLTDGGSAALIAAAQGVQAALEQEPGMFGRWLAASVGKFQVQRPALRDALRRLGTPLATTNYDTLLSQDGGPQPVAWSDEQTALQVLRGDQPGVLHVHGVHLQPSSVVFGNASYDAVLADQYAQFRQHVLVAVKTLLFVGCGPGVRDPNIGAMLDWADAAEVRHSHFRLVHAGETDGVGGGCLADVPFGESHDSLPAFLDELAAAASRSAPSAPASQLRRLSRIADADADVVGVERDQLRIREGTSTVRLSDGLYVRRPAEEEVISHLQDGPRSVVVVAEPGTGKTSLLWRLRERLEEMDDVEAYLIRASQLRLLGDTDGVQPDRELLMRVVATARTTGKRIALLIDTADLRLRVEPDRTALVTLLLELDEAGVFLVVSSRPREAAALAPLHAARVELGTYGVELEEAVSRHVGRYYRSAGIADVDEAVARIVDSAARGRPVRELIEHPLRLRMLFETYAPFEVVDAELDTAGLYDAFWERRVRQDFRPGAPGTSGTVDPAEDLRGPARLVARVLLALGGPEQPTTAVEAALDESNALDALPRLRARGLLADDPDLVAFFHQTLFEYVAARDFLESDERRPIDLSTRAAERPDDAFLAAIHEQLLVRASAMGGAACAAAEHEVVRLLTDDHSARRESGLYAYVSWRVPSKRLDDVVDTVLRTADVDLIATFVRLAPGAHQARLDGILGRLELAWEHAPRHRAGMLGVLRRLAPRSPASVVSLMNKVDLIDGLLAQPEVAAKEAGLFGETVLTAARAADGDALHEQAWAMLFAWVERVLRHNVTPSAASEVIRQIACEPSIPLASSIATRMQARLGNVSKRRAAYGLYEALGELWAREWEEQHLSTSDVLARLTGRDDLVGLSQLHGAAGFITNAALPVDLVAALLEQPLEARWNWVTHMFPHVLSAFRPTADEAGNDSASAVLANRVRDVAGMPVVAGADRRTDLGVMLRAALQHSTLSPESVATLLEDAPGLGARAPWIDPDWQGKTLARAALGGHSTAAAVLDDLLAGVEPCSPRLNAVLSSGLRGQAIGGVQAASVFALDLALATHDDADVDLACELLEGRSDVMSARADLLRITWQRLAAASSPYQRRLGHRILAHLAVIDLAGPTDIAWLEGRLQGGVTELCWPLVKVVEAEVRFGRLDPNTAIALLDPPSCASPQLVNRLRTARLSIAAQHAKQLGLSRVMDLALETERRPNHAMLLTGPLVDAAAHEPAAAVVQLTRWIERSEAGAPRSRSTRDAANALRPAIRQIALVSDVEIAAKLLGLAKVADEATAEQICSAVGLRDEFPIRQRIDALLRDATLPDKALGALRASTRRRGRAGGNEGWPELMIDRPGGHPGPRWERRDGDGPATSAPHPSEPI